MSISGRQSFERGDFTFLGNVSPSFVSLCSTFLTAACTYCDEPNVQALAPFSRCTQPTLPPRYISGGLIDSSLSVNLLPISSRIIDSALSLTTRQSSVYSRTYSQYSDPSAFLAGLIQISGSPLQEMNPSSSSIHFRRYTQKS